MSASRVPAALTAFMAREGAVELLARLTDGPTRLLAYRSCLDRAAAAAAGDWEVVLATWPESLIQAAQAGIEAAEPILPAYLPTRADVPQAPARRLWAVSGRSVWIGDPLASAGSWVRLDFPGALRSARLGRLENRDWCFAGGKRGIWACPLDSPSAVVEYMLPGSKDPRGGVNGIALTSGRVWSTHSEFGLSTWNEGVGTSGETLHPQLTHIHRTTRAVTAWDAKSVCFATGRIVYRCAGAEKSERPTAYTPELAHSVSALAVAGGICAAACATGRSGEVWAWSKGETAKPEAIRRGIGPVGTIHFAALGGIPHLVIASDEHSVSAVVPGMDCSMAYEAGSRRIAYAAAASDRIIGMDLDGKTLVLWDVSRPTMPLREIDVRDIFGQPIIDCGLSV